MSDDASYIAIHLEERNLQHFLLQESWPRLPERRLTKQALGIPGLEADHARYLSVANKQHSGDFLLSLPKSKEMTLLNTLERVHRTLTTAVRFRLGCESTWFRCELTWFLIYMPWNAESRDVAPPLDKKGVHLTSCVLKEVTSFEITICMVQRDLQVLATSNASAGFQASGCLLCS